MKTMSSFNLTQGTGFNMTKNSGFNVTHTKDKENNIQIEDFNQTNTMSMANT